MWLKMESIQKNFDMETYKITTKKKPKYFKVSFLNQLKSTWTCQEVKSEANSSRI